MPDVVRLALDFTFEVVFFESSLPPKPCNINQYRTKQEYCGSE